MRCSYEVTLPCGHKDTVSATSSNQAEMAAKRIGMCYVCLAFHKVGRVDEKGSPCQCTEILGCGCL